MKNYTISYLWEKSTLFSNLKKQIALRIANDFLRIESSLKPQSSLNRLKQLAIIVLVGLCSLTTYAQCVDPSPTGDCDGDLILNGVDLDDDNDGILDTEEITCVSPANSGAPPAIWWDLNSSPFPGGLEENFILDYTTSVSGITFGSGITVSQGGGTLYNVANIDGNNLTEAITNDEYFEISFTTSTSFPQPITISEFQTFMRNRVVFFDNLGIAISDDNFTTNTVLFNTSIPTVGSDQWVSYPLICLLYTSPSPRD